ncbi:MAG: helix-turn-helix domain-containing protein [Clostridia bacterium]|nr:helix-turn-helix domain-containing protein [Clostridia bacterium]
MNVKHFGNNLSLFRRKKDLTQAQFAEKLGVTDKTVSKWECGRGLPNVSQLPAISRILCVRVDDLLRESGGGIVVAGNLIADTVKTIDVYPVAGKLANIQQSCRASGGCVSNVSINLATIDPSLDITAVGMVGNDENGRFLLDKLRSAGVNTDNVSITGEYSTAFCDVMSLPSGERTFFSSSGANMHFSPSDIDVAHLSCKIFHIGYLLLLDQFDLPDEEYGTVMARFLCTLQKKGIKTSLDVVSSSDTDKYERVIIPSLKYANYVIFNEIECCNIWKIQPYTASGTLDIDRVYLAMQKTMAAGVKEKVIVHAKDGGFCLSADGSFTKVGSYEIPADLIKGRVGAGDAFCSGCLYGLYNDWSDRELLEFAAATAACSLFSANSSDGAKSRKAIEKMVLPFKRREL